MSSNDDGKLTQDAIEAVRAASREALDQFDSVADTPELQQFIHAVNLHSANMDDLEVGPNSDFPWPKELKRAIAGDQGISKTSGEPIALQLRRQLATFFEWLVVPKVAYATCFAACVVVIVLAVQAVNLKEQKNVAELEKRDRLIAELRGHPGTGGTRVVELKSGKSVPIEDIDEAYLSEPGAVAIQILSSPNPRSVAMGGGDFKVIGPTRTRVTGKGVTLHWNRVNGGTGKVTYRVTLAKEDETQQVEPGPETIDDIYVVSPDKLEPGATYTWFVEATSDATMKSDMGRFQVVNSIEQKKAADVLSDDHLTHLQRAVYMENLGLLDDAAKEFDLYKFKNAAVKKVLLRRLAAARELN